MSEPGIVIIEDEEMVRMALEQWLRLSGFAVASAATPQEGLALVDDRRPEVVLTDLRMPGGTGIDVLRAVRERSASTEVILITGHGDVPMAVEAMRLGAFDFVQKPYEPDQLVRTLRQAAEQGRLKREIADLRRRLDGGETELSTRLVGNSPAMERLRQTLLQLAQVDADIIVRGETGTGKEVVARCLHDFSARAGGPFIAVNCAAIPDDLIESELFGHEAGAFTGARAQRIGKFEAARGGTLLLDEIESMPLLAQAKVLRVIQERVVERLGGNRQVPLDLRIVAAAKADLEAESRAGRFRADLYYRLDMATLTLPPLRERGDDVILLFQHFVDGAARRFARSAPPLHPADVDALMTHDWPGNVRELKAAADRFVLGIETAGRSLSAMISPRPQGQAQTASLAERVATYERHVIEAELVRHDDSVMAVADALQVPRRTLNEKMARLGVRRAAPD